MNSLQYAIGILYATAKIGMNEGITFIFRLKKFLKNYFFSFEIYLINGFTFSS